MVRRNEEIVSQVLSMNEEQLTKFLAGLTPDVRNYLDVILEKAEKNTDKLVLYIESQK